MHLCAPLPLLKHLHEPVVPHENPGVTGHKQWIHGPVPACRQRASGPPLNPELRPLTIVPLEGLDETGVIGRFTDGYLPQTWY